MKLKPMNPTPMNPKAYRITKPKATTARKFEKSINYSFKYKNVRLISEAIEIKKFISDD